MKILLIKPETVGIFSFTYLVEHEPLEMEYLYTVFKNNGHETVIYDRRYELCSLKKKIRITRPDVVCITGYITQQELMKRYCRVIKSFDKNIRIILGGSNVEINYENYFDSQADYLYHLSGLSNLVKLVDFIDSELKGDQKERNYPTDIPGICYRKEDKWVVNQKVIETPDDLPIPDRTYLYANINRFRYLCFKPLALVKNSYSCKKACNFCFCTNRNSGRYACRHVESLVDEIASLDVPAIHITDDDFLVDEEYLREFIRLIRIKDVHKKFLIYGRADFIAHHEELIKELADIGLSLVMVGLEATNDDELDSYNKRTSLEENEECIRILSENSIFCAGLFIVHQHMTKEDFKKLYEWISARDIIPTVSVFTPMQGSATYKEYEKDMITRDVTKQDLFHCLLKPEHMSVRAFTRLYYRLSLKLAWHNRKSALYSENNYPGAVIYIFKVLFIKIKRAFVL
jgi:radical SAM superfamily enzyme YgiQ (UPF0313 family)